MLLSDEITMTLDRRTNIKLSEFKYRLIVHNYNKEEALISVVSEIKINRRTNENLILEYEQLKIPHKLKAKEWLIKIVLEKDDILKNAEKYRFTDDEVKKIKEIKEILELEYKKIKIKGF
jgi:hypothetical protein